MRQAIERAAGMVSMREMRRRDRSEGWDRARLRFYAGLGLAVLLALACGLTGWAQSSGGNGGRGMGQGNAPPINPTRTDLSSMMTADDPDPVMMQRRLLALNIQRQKQMEADSEKLLKLAKELNDEVAKANSGALSGDELRKIAEIEKLARNVRERMVQGVGEPASILPPPTPIVFPSH